MGSDATPDWEENFVDPIRLCMRRMDDFPPGQLAPVDSAGKVVIHALPVRNQTIHVGPLRIITIPQV
jgi:hypothetical protein